MFVLVVLGATLVGFAVASALGLAPAWAARGGCGACSASTALARRRTTVVGLVQAANVPFLVFVLCLGVVVSGVTQHGLGAAMRRDPARRHGASRAARASPPLPHCWPTWSTTCPRCWYCFRW